MERVGAHFDRAAVWTAALLLLLMAVLAGGSALHESPTTDEPAHLGAGVSSLQKLDLRMNAEHPPLAKALAALPLALQGVRADYDSISWNYGEHPLAALLAEWPFGYWLLTRWNDQGATLMWARVPMLMLTLALGALLYVCATRIGGKMGGWLCLSLYVSAPVFLAYGPLVLTDVPVTFFAVLTMWTYATMWAKGGAERTIPRFAFALAGALLSKYSAGILIVAFVAFQLSVRWRPTVSAPTDKEESRAWRRRGWRCTLKGVAWAGVIVYAVYFVFTLGQPTNALEILGANPAALILRRLVMPVWTYLLGLGVFAVTSSRPTFILGHGFPHGVPFYFPALFLLKTPLSALAVYLLGLPIVVAAKRRRDENALRVANGFDLHWRATWVFLLVFTAFCLLSRMNISVRHFTIPIALSLLLLAALPQALAQLAASGWRMARSLSWATAALAIFSLATAVGAYPHYIPFINSLSMGREGFMLMNGSNLDWGQSLPEIRRFADERHLASVPVCSIGGVDPAAYVPQARLWNCQDPAPIDAGQWVVVSAAMIVDGHNCSWLLRYPREPLAGGSMYAIRMPDPIPAAGAPGGPPPADQFWSWFGMPGTGDFRAIVRECVRDPRELPKALEQMRRLFVERKKERSELFVESR